jgi:hypothetical protein
VALKFLLAASQGSLIGLNFILVFAEHAIAQLGGEYRLIGIAASLTWLWIVIRASALLLRDPLLATAVAAIAWIVAALDIMAFCPRRRQRSTSPVPASSW